MIYLVEGYTQYSKVSMVHEEYVKAKEHMKQLEEYGYSVSVTPLDMPRKAYGQACLQAVHDYFDNNSLDS